MTKSWIAFLCTALCALVFPLAALAEDCFVIDVDSLDMASLRDSAYVSAHLSAQAQGLRVRKFISDSNELAARVRLTITQAETSAVVYDKNFGYVSGTFDSGDIYLPYVDNNTIPYLITLNVEDWTYALPFMHLQPRLTYNSGCTYGVRLRDYQPSLTSNWVMGTMLDLDALRAQGTLTVPLCASNLYLVGQATLTLDADQLTVNLAFLQSANVEVHGCAVYVIGDVNALTSDNPSAITLPAWAPGQAIDVTGLTTALLYVPISLSYDPVGLSEFGYDLGTAELSTQLALWSANAQGTPSLSNEDTAPTEAWVPQDELLAPPEDGVAPDDTTPEMLPQEAVPVP